MLKGLCHSETLVVEHKDTAAVYGSTNALWWIVRSLWGS